QAFVGGKAKIDAIKAIHRTGAMSMRTPQGPMDVEADELMQFPDMRRTVMKTPMGEITMVSTSAGAFMAGPMGTQDVPASQRDVQAREQKTELLTVLKNIDNPKYVFTTSAPDTIEISAEGASAKWVVDPASGKLLRKISTVRAGEQVTEYTE